MLYLSDKMHKSVEISQNWNVHQGDLKLVKIMRVCFVKYEISEKFRGALPASKTGPARDLFVTKCNGIQG